MTIAMIFLSSRIGHAQTGEQDYQHYCAGCHRSGKGASTPMTGATPPDLSKLAKRNRGKFPFEEVYEVTAGQRNIIWHQRHPDMPYWGDVFYDEAKGSPGERKAEVKERILGIVRYVQQTQRK